MTEREHLTTLGLGALKDLADANCFLRDLMFQALSAGCSLEQRNHTLCSCSKLAAALDPAMEKTAQYCLTMLETQVDTGYPTGRSSGI